MPTTATRFSRTKFAKVTTELCPECGLLRRPSPGRIKLVPFDHPIASGIFEECNMTACSYFEIRAITVHGQPAKKSRPSFARRDVKGFLKGLGVLVFGI